MSFFNIKKILHKLLLITPVQSLTNKSLRIFFSATIAANVKAVSVLVQLTIVNVALIM